MPEHSEKNGVVYTDLPFFYRLEQRSDPLRESLFLLHGSGVDETTMLPIARQIARGATLISVRGRILQEDGFRWFERITPTSFGQASIRAETSAFAAFASAVTERHGLDLALATFIGYSNGANLVSSLMLLNPGLVRKAALLRAMPVLDDVPPTDLRGTRVLVIAGAADQTYGPFAPALVTMLHQRGAEIDARIVASGHEIGNPDAAIVRQWLGASASVASVA